MRVKSSSQIQNQLNLQPVLKLSFFLFAISAFVLLSSSGCEKSSTESPTYITNYVSEDSLTNPNVLPRVIFTNPANGAVGPFDDPDVYQNSITSNFVIEFNKLINLRKLDRNAIKMTCDGEACPIEITNIEYTGDGGHSGQMMYNILVYTYNRFMFNKVYAVTVDTTLEDIHGNRLKTPYEFSFISEPYFRAYYGYPGTEDISSDRNDVKIGVLFNSTIDTTIFNYIQITPLISGSWTFSEYAQVHRTAYYSAKEDLLFDTNYTVSVSGDARDASGVLIGQPYQFSFTTEPFQAYHSSSSGGKGPGGFSRENKISFKFNSALDTSSVRSSVLMEPDLPFHISFDNYSQSNDIRKFYLTLEDSAMKPETLYTITLKKTIPSSRGDFMKEDYVYQFTTGSIND